LRTENKTAILILYVIFSSCHSSGVWWMCKLSVYNKKTIFDFELYTHKKRNQTKEEEGVLNASGEKFYPVGKQVFL